MDTLYNHKRVLLTIPEWDFNVTTDNTRNTNNNTRSSKTATGCYDSQIINSSTSTDCRTSSSINEHATNTNTEFLDDLVLLQLPPNWTVSDLISCNNNNNPIASISTNDNDNEKGNNSVELKTITTTDNDNTTTTNYDNNSNIITNHSTYFIGAKKHSTTGSTSTQSASASASSLVLNHKNTSFDVFRVETSNALVMIPPKQLLLSSSTTISPNKRKSLGVQQQQQQNDENDNNNNNNENEIITTRLIKRGGSGAYYLELRVRRIHPYQHVQTIIPIWNPYTSTISSLLPVLQSTSTVQQLAITLQVSMYQINIALQTIQAFPIISSSTSSSSSSNQENYYYYVLLDDEILFNVYNSIVYTLAEVGYDYAIQDIVVDTFSNEVLQRMSYEEKLLFIDTTTNYTHNNTINDNSTMIKSIIRFCIHQLTVDTPSTTIPTTTKTNNPDVVRFSVSKVASFVAKRIFIYDKINIQDNDNEEYFLQKWQADMPGVGLLYQVSTTMLRGIAIQTMTAVSSPANTNTKTNTTTTTSKNNKLVWKYFPKESIVPIHSNNNTNNNNSQQPKIVLTIDEQLQKCMDVLFTAKEYWLLEELLPYLERIIHIKTENDDDTRSTGTCSATNNSDDATSILSNTLVRYTKVITMDGNQYYQKK